MDMDGDDFMPPDAKEQMVRAYLAAIVGVDHWADGDQRKRITGSDVEVATGTLELLGCTTDRPVATQWRWDNELVCVKTDDGVEVMQLY